MNKLIWTFFTLSLTILSCSESDNATEPPFKKDWTLNLSDYLGSNYSDIVSYSLNEYGLTLLDEQTALVHEFSKKGRHLVEVNFLNGTFEHQSKVDFVLLDTRKKNNGTVLLSGYDSDDFFLGNYDQDTHEFSSTLIVKSELINDPPTSKAIYMGDDVLFTHDSNISPNNNEVYVAKWDFEGNQIWRKNIDITNQNKIATIQSIETDYLFFSTVQNIDVGEGSWKVAKLSNDGNVLWHKKINDFGWVFKIFSSNNGDFIVLNGKGISKHGSNGNTIWANDLSEYQKTYNWGNGISTSDGGAVFQLVSDYNDIELLIKVDAAGKVVWEEPYWEDEADQRVSLSFLELPNHDILVFSTSGYLTLYRSN